MIRELNGDHEDLAAFSQDKFSQFPIDKLILELRPVV